jgi:LacI family transcriptional regulator
VKESNTEMKTVLLLQSGCGFHSDLEVSGVMRYSQGKGWNVKLVECGPAALSRFSRSSAGEISRVDEIIRLWKPTGLIVSPDISSYVLAHPELKDLPSVIWDSDPSVLPSGRTCVYSDAEVIAKDAADELVRLGFANYAYVPFDDDTHWSISRGRAFNKVMGQLGYDVSVMAGHFTPMCVSSHFKAIKSFISSLPRPCAVFAACDLIAEEVLTACRALGIDVPREIAVLGVDDDRAICENARPSLSSIRSNYEEGGYIAAQLLDELMRNQGKTVASRGFGTFGVARRASTRRFLQEDRGVVAALEYIRLHACEDISVDNVVERFQCGRRMAEMRFRRVVGKTIVRCIHEARIDQVKKLLINPSVDLTLISDSCGYRSLVDMRRVFKRITGCSPVAWRRLQWCGM